MTPKTTPKDFFLHLGATIALYASVIALINLAFEIVNRLLPDQLSNYFVANSIVWPISILVVFVPVLYVIEWLIAKDISKMAEKASIWVRRWRIYLTLFLTGVTIAVDLVALINVYLNGEISSRFIWKVIIVLIITGAVFKYYFFSINPTMRWASMVRKYMPWTGAIMVIGTIIGGFVIVGSPAEQRAIRFDEQRVNDISNAAYSVAHYWQEYGKMPDNLTDLPEYSSMNGAPKDPVTNAPYDYIKGSENNSFKICATFSASSADNGAYYQITYPKGQSAFYDWTHPAGYYCFDKTISPVDFPPVNTSSTPTSVPVRAVAPKAI